MTKMPKKVTTEDLARMMAKGFEGVDKRFDSVATDLVEIKQEIEDINLKFDNVAYKFEVKDLTRRVKTLEENN